MSAVLLVPLSPEDKAARVAELRARVCSLLTSEEAKRFCTDATLERFNRACDNNVDKAEEFLRRTLAWREAKRPWEAACVSCAASPRAHSLRCVGWTTAADAARRPVLFHSFSQAEGRHNAAQNALHLMRLLEEMTRRMDAASPPDETWCWVFDFFGYSLWDNNPATVLACTSFLPMHPNRLFKVVLLDAPAAFSTVWNVASGYLSPITQAKVVFSTLPELRQTIHGWAGEEMTAWLEAEAADNRERAAAGAAAAKQCVHSRLEQSRVFSLH